MLQKLASFAGIKGPVVTIIMDGYGLPKTDVGSAIADAKKPNLDRLFANYPNIRLRAHGTAVGIAQSDDADVGAPVADLLHQLRCAG